MPSLDVLAERLAARMEQTPNDIEGWMMLGRTYFALGNAPQALAALERAYALAPDDLDVKLTYAEAIAANNDNRLEGKPAELIGEVLAADPDHMNARWLSGVLSFQRGQYTGAIQSWQRILAQTDPNGSDAADLRGLIEEARQRGGIASDNLPNSPTAQAKPAQPEPSPATESPTPPPSTSATAASAPAPADADRAAAPAASIQAEVSIAPELANQIPQGAAVFVYAKAAAGPPMPLAAQRIGVGDLPATLTLDDSMAMTPAMKLSSFPEVIVGARISASGQAMPMSGDLQGESGPIKVAGDRQAPVEVIIDRRLP
jgi:cytochrome c-type biogenesis protein CcmH